MNTRLIIAAVTFAFASIAAHAAGGNQTTTLAAIQAHAGPRLVVACRDGKLPGYAALSTLLDTNNAGLLYAVRVDMHRIVQHECVHGMGYVAFVATTAKPELAPQLAVAGTP